MENYYHKFIYPSAYKIIVIGDLHGDYAATLRVLLRSKIIDKKLNWKGGKTHVVQMGDILDRRARCSTYTDEDSEMKIFKLLKKLKKQAYDAGGAFHCMMGNHEFMNVLGDFSYVSKKGMNHFKKIGGRKKHFQPGSMIARDIAKNMNVVIKIGKFIFVHGGCSPKILNKYKIPFLNKYMKSFLNGNARLMNDRDFRECFYDSGSILWNRQFSGGSGFNKEKLRNSLAKHKCRYMVVGHSIQNKINCKNGTVWCVDVGMSKAFGVNNIEKIQSLEILRNGKKFNIIR
jgi:hypothetical protein